MTTDKILIIAPHCDDEILGCGGIMAKAVEAGNEVYVAIVTNGHLGAPELFKKEGTERVRNEALEAHEYLGVTKTYFLDFPAVRLETTPSYQISLKIQEIIREHAINVLYIPHYGDIHNDHGISYHASLVAARPINNNSIMRIYAYETLSETEWAPPGAHNAFIPTVFIDISNYMNKKIEAFKYFTTQIKQAPHPRSLESIKNLAKYRGSTVSKEFAESFMLVRQID